MSAIDHETGALSFDLRRRKRPGDTGVRANRRPSRLAIDSQGVGLKEVVVHESHN
jgi:hypothetical protein